MKIRNGFVSNSSSSSFIVAFDKTPKTVDDIVKYIFNPGQKRYNHPYPNEDMEQSFSVYDVADTIFKDILKQNIMTEEEIINAFNSGYLEDAPDFPTYEIDDTHETHEKKWEKYHKKCKIIAKKKAKDFIKKNKGKVIYSFSFGDSHGEHSGYYGSALEHGDLFKNVPHIRISNH